MQAFIPTRPAPAPPGVSLLGLKATTILEIGEAVENGFHTSLVKRFASHINASLQDTLKLLDLSESTFHQHQRHKQPLSRSVSINALLLSQITETAEQYFEDKTKAHAWLATPRATFGGKTPLQFSLLLGGVEYVRTVLNRLEHGIMS